MRSQNKICAGLILMIFAIILYSALHNVENLYIFHNFGENLFFGIYKNFQSHAIRILKRLPFFSFVKNHLVDLLWFLSFSLIFSAIFSVAKKTRFAVLILLACLSEFSQLFYENLGTFDILDLLCYFSIAVVFLVV